MTEEASSLIRTIRLWAQHRSITMLHEEWSGRYGFYTEEDEVRWGRDLERMIYAYRMIPYDEFRRRYPELSEFFTRIEFSP
jgi:hypothetical protein